MINEVMEENQCALFGATSENFTCHYATVKVKKYHQKYKNSQYESSTELQKMCMNSNISLNSRQSIKMLTLMSCETRQHTPSWPKGTNPCKTHIQYYDDKALSCLPTSKPTESPHSSSALLCCQWEDAIWTAVHSQVEFRFDLVLPLKI